MRPGYIRFIHFLEKTNELIINAAKQPNPALWLLQHNGRTPFFMLQGLAKIHEAFHNKKKFKKIRNNYFKIIEDGLGQIDYYDFYIKEFEGIITIPKTAITYLKEQMQKKLTDLNEILIKDGWIDENKSRITCIKEKLEGADWKKEKKEIKLLLDFYDNEIKEIFDFYKKIGNGFTQLEEQVHELRRKLRWLSIYPQAMLGSIQYTNSAHPIAELPKYLTPEILNSPYNIFPEAGSNKYFLLLEKNYFFSLSWMINELGNEKDKGLGIYQLAAALEHTENLDKEKAIARAGEILLGNAKALEQILHYCHTICTDFFKERNLNKLVYGIAKASE